jgi:hypothetical protein
MQLKPRYLGIIGAIIVLISLALPWWTMTMSSSVLGTTYSVSLSVYTYQATATEMGRSVAVSIDLWYAWTALALVIVSAALGILGSIIQSTRLVLLVGAVLALMAVMIFAAGLQSQVSAQGPLPGGPTVGLFSSGSFLGVNYTTYLSFGFWLALVGAILMLVACRKAPVATAPIAQPQQPMPQRQPPTQES